jgi:hypothetical protein
MDLPTDSASEILSPTAARARLSELDAQISVLEISLRDLQHKRKALQNHLYAYKYPVLTLPNEITSEIFTHFLPSYPERPLLVSLHSAFTLGQICGKWREIALSTPSLWHAISINVDRRTSHTIPLHLLELWLERSGLQPISFTLATFVTGMKMMRLIEALVQHIHRCEEMTVELDFSQLVVLQSNDMPLLHTLTLGSHYSYPNVGETVLFHRAPNLATVVLAEDFEPFQVILPWSQITTLHALSLTEAEFAKVLRLAVNLVHCTAVLQLYNDDLPTVPPHMLLQDLTLTPSIGLQLGSIAILDKLTLPALRRLQVPEDWFSPNPCTRVAAWIFRAAGNLEELRITHCDTSEIAYREVLSSVPKISVDPLKRDVDDSDEESDSD